MLQNVISTDASKKGIKKDKIVCENTENERPIWSVFFLQKTAWRHKYKTGLDIINTRVKYSSSSNTAEVSKLPDKIQPNAIFALEVRII